MENLLDNLNCSKLQTIVVLEKELSADTNMYIAKKKLGAIIQKFLYKSWILIGLLKRICRFPQRSIQNLVKYLRWGVLCKLTSFEKCTILNIRQVFEHSSVPSTTWQNSSICIQLQPCGYRKNTIFLITHFKLLV